MINNNNNNMSEITVDEYLNGYPSLVDNPCARQNVLFYSGQTRLYRKKIDDFLTFYQGNYAFLETAHNYVQWLFPIHEWSRANRHAFILHRNEAATIRSQYRDRVIRAYSVMLDFLGLQLLDVETGAVAPNEVNCRDRFANWEGRPHNHLRVTRMIKSLGELGLEHFKLPLLLCIHEQICSGALGRTENGSILVNAAELFWFRLLRCETDRSALFEVRTKTLR